MTLTSGTNVEVHLIHERVVRGGARSGRRSPSGSAVTTAPVAAVPSFFRTTNESVAA